jgi:hypothetical protein
LVDEISIGTSMGNLRKEGCSAQTRRQPVVGFNETYEKAKAQGLVETLGKTTNA